MHTPAHLYAVGREVTPETAASAAWSRRNASFGELAEPAPANAWRIIPGFCMEAIVSPDGPSSYNATLHGRYAPMRGAATREACASAGLQADN